MTVRALEDRDRDAAVEVLTSAFAGDVLLVWACGARERQGMRTSCRMTIALSIAARAAYGYFDGERLIAVALFQRSEQTPTAWQSIRAGFWRVPLDAGPRAALRIIRAFGEADAFKAQVMGDERYFYLDTLGVHRAAAGRGLGQHLLRTSLSRLREEAPRTCFLLTHQPHNVRLYERLGFEVIGECSVTDSPITFWGMRQAHSLGKPGGF
ncbi:MAG TPA: GNAT family N-acetyltransferase [Polyangiaceae bacterium]|nr:GNAT family N-acetyltransferase [Polyangiaceae bacterium]